METAGRTNPPVGSLYDPAFVRSLFDEMSATYGMVNLISSFGFCWRWRRQCVKMSPPDEGSQVVDLMSGMGELGPDLARRIGADGHLTALDISPRMCRLAKETNLSGTDCELDIKVEDVLRNTLPNGSADHIFSSFGLKTFEADQVQQLAIEVFRVLKPGGSFAFLEISKPRARWIGLPYGFYVNRVIPVVGKMFMGNWDNYRLLGIYTERFGSCVRFADVFRAAGLSVEVRSFFFGCATGLVGRKPKPT